MNGVNKMFYFLTLVVFFGKITPMDPSPSYEFLYQVPKFEKFKITENEEFEKKNYIIFSHGDQNEISYKIFFDEDNNSFTMEENDNQVNIKYKTLSESDFIEITSCSFKKESSPSLLKKMLNHIINQKASPFGGKKIAINFSLFDLPAAHFFQKQVFYFL